MSQAKRTLDRVLAVALSVMMLIGMLPISSVYAMAGNKSVLETNLGDIDFVVNEATEFTVTSAANDDAGNNVKGYFTFSDETAIAKLEYYETDPRNEGWHDLTGPFGPEAGFPIMDATSRFRVTFNRAGEYNVTIALKDVADESVVYCSTSANISVSRKTSTITTDIASKEITVFEPVEFSFTSKANDDTDKYVKGYFEFSDDTAIEKLEYYETAAGMQGWYPLTGPFGPEAGFPVIDGTSKFRVTFKKAGTYSLEVSLKQVSDGAVVCKTNANVTVGKAQITGIDMAPTSNKYTGAQFPLATVTGDIKNTDTVKYTITGDANVYSSIPKASAVGNYEVTITVDRGSNYKPFTKTITSSILLGDIELGGIKVQGLEGKYTGIAQNAVSVTGKGDYSLMYKLDGGEWTSTIPTVTNAGSYTVEVKATKEHYNDKDVTVDKADSAIYPFNVYIAKAEQTGFAFTNSNPAPLAYKGTFVNTANGGQTDGDITYEVVSGAEYVSVQEDGTVTAIKAGGMATIKATRAGNANYEPISDTYNISTIKAAQSDFVFAQTEYTVQYGTTGLTVTAEGGQSNGNVTYTIDESVDIASISSADNKGNITFNSGKKGNFTVTATLAGNENYEPITATATVKVLTNDFSSKVIVDECPSCGWYQDSVSIKPAAGFKISYSNQFSADWKDSITITTEGQNSPDDVYVMEVATGYISEAVPVADIYIDKTNPTGLNISYSTSVRDVILETISFGFYNADMTVTLTATDLVSKIDHFVYKIGDGAEVTINKADITFSGTDGEVATASFSIPANLSRSKITLTAFDTAGRYTTVVGDKTLVVDNVKPVVSVSYDNNNAAHSSYFKGSRTATITINEENFFKDNLYDIIPGTENQYLTITVGKRGDNDDAYSNTVIKPAFVKEGDVYKATYTFTEDADYTFDVVFYDYSLNKNADVDYGTSVAPTAFTIDNTNPVLNISYNDGNATESEANDGYFTGKRVATFKVTEHNFDPSELNFTTFTAKNVQAGDVNAAQMATFISVLRDIANWSKNGNVYTANIEFDADANYKIELNYSDLAGNAATKEESDFCLDNTKPYVVTDAEISYSASILDTILNAITFGFYNAEMEATITAYDETAGIDYFTYSYTVSEGGNSEDTGKANVVISHDNITFTENGKKATASFKIPPQFRGYVSFTATDKSGNTSNLFTDDKCIVVDSKAAGVTVTYDNNNKKNGKYFDADRTVKISISADNFFEDALYTPILKNNSEGVAVPQSEDYLVITVGKRTDDQTSFTYTDIKPAFTRNGDVYEATYTFSENADYTFDIKYTDKSLNVYDSYQKDEFTIDKTKPTLDVVFTEPAHSNGNQYRADRSATITIVEHNFDAKDVDTTVTAANAQATVFDYSDYLSKNENWTTDGDTHTATITFSTEAHYTFDIDYKDLAGNAADDYEAVSFTVDKTAPKDLSIKINNQSVLGSMNTLAFDTFYGSTVTVKLDADCDISGLESLKYQKVANESEYDENGTWEAYNTEGITVAPSEKFIIYFRAEDKAGNVSIVRSTGIVVDNQKPIGETNAPEIDILPATPNANGMHKGDVNVDLKVVDPKFAGNAASENGHYSGLNKITYKIYTTDTNAVEEGTLFERTSKTEGAVFDTDRLVSSWGGKITIDSNKFNSNNVIVEIIAVDNAGNTRKTTTNAGDIKIDITAPTIVVSYDNNDADSSTFFKADRTATVVITERNFNEKDVVVAITNTDGTVPTISKFTKADGTGNGDDTTWTATITYAADGDYTFDIDYTDLAGNKCAGETFAQGTVAFNAFTIDKTVPVISVSYDNNEALNGNYYKAVRTATIVITEHNFNADRVIITNTATDDGTDTTKPTVSAWNSNGDKHTATIYYGKDAKYTFDIAMTDKAGNASADYTEETFYVDMTMPTLDITGIANNSANKGDVIPVITYLDTNYDADKVTITLTGANRKSVELDGSYADIHNGRTFTFKNFAEEKAIDDIYTLTATLTDKAGNTTEKTITFSVNRFGSTYALDETAEQLNGTYVKEPVDVVVTETNADELSNIKITLFKDGEAIVLKDGTDYKIDLNGGNGQWFHYTYTIFAKNFAADGVYSLTIESDDKAGNSAKNDQDTKDKAINFGVDSTLPIINIENLESKTTYALDNMTVKMSIKDNLKLTKVIVELDGKEYKIWAAEELEAIIQNGGNFTFDISGDSTNAHNLVVYAIDAAGNGEKISDTELPANAEEVEDFYVTTNLWVRYYTNKPLFFGSIAGVIVLAGLIVTLVVYKKKKNEKN